MENVENLAGFLPLYFVAQFFGLLAIILTFYWIVTSNGFGFTGNALFNWHPFLMIIGMVFFLGNGVLTFRAFRNLHKDTLKLLHTGINCVALLFVLLATIAVFANHIQGNMANLYTLHSWIGMGVVILFVFQAIIGFTAYLYPGYSGPLRSKLMPYHVFFGFVIFAGGIASVISGINEKAIFKLGANYEAHNFEGVLLNAIGVFVSFFGIAFIYAATNVFYKRYTRPEDSQLLNRND